MNKRIKLFTGLIIILAVVFTGCSLLGDLFSVPLSIEARILSFQNAINTENRSTLNILSNFGPEVDMQQYDNAKELAYWSDAFPDELTFTFVVTNKTDTEAVLVGGTKKDSDGNLVDTVVYEFRMHEEEDGNWLIREIYEDPEGTDTMLIRKVDF